MSEWCDVGEKKDQERKKGFMVVIRQVRQQSRRHLVEVVKEEGAR